MRKIKEAENRTVPAYLFPWDRIWARGIDTLIFLIVLYYLCFPLFWIQIDKIMLPIYGPSGTEGFWFFELWWTIFKTSFFLFYEIFFITIFSTTPGKAVFGLSIVGQDGKRLPLTYAVLRAIILCAGLFLFFMPYISLVIPIIICFVHLYYYKTRSGKFIWDKSNRWMMSSKKEIPLIIKLIGPSFLLLFFLLIILFNKSAPDIKVMHLIFGIIL
jgi:uncharacterized RDD family membrane protein YckC